MGEISVPDEKVKPGTGGQNPAEYFRKEFDARDGIKRARVYATCHGAYQLSVNGIRPDDREFAPEFTVYSKYLCYQTYDVTPFLREGRNVIGMLVGTAGMTVRTLNREAGSLKPNILCYFR